MKSNYELINNSRAIRKKKKIPINRILEETGWANRSVLCKKENNILRTTILEALILSKLYKEPIGKIFTLKVS